VDEILLCRPLTCRQVVLVLSQQTLVK
jgi:hypothetical protein